MPWIQNVSRHAIKNGLHYDPGKGSVLIQIIDPNNIYPNPAFRFDHVYQFEFADIDERSPDWESLQEFAITQSQAKAIVSILDRALKTGRNVVVHCNAGLCRSGAVAEVGVMMGFVDTESPRTPNTYVKWQLIAELNYPTY